MAAVTIVKTAAALILLLATRGGAADLTELEQRGTLRVIVWTGNLQALYDVKGPSGLDHELLLGFAQFASCGWRSSRCPPRTSGSARSSRGAGT